ncbi:putative 8-oxoguanine DNA-glycosylase, DNA glycosylase, major facilitator superfamily [Plasmopara halstedii]
MKLVAVPICLVLGFISALFALDSALCIKGCQSVCIMSVPANMVSLILSSATLVPVATCLISAWLNARDQSHNEHKYLFKDNTRKRQVVTYLYASHLLSSWGDRMWAFAVPIVLMDIFVDTLLPSAVFSLATNVVCILTIPMVGHYLDKWNRWTIVKYAIVLENVMVVFNAIILGLILYFTNADGVHRPEWTWTLAMMFLGTLICGSLGQVLNDVQTLCIERDWVVVIAGPNNSTALANLNTFMRRIDLSCSILGPMAFGLIVDFAGGDPTTRAMVGAAVVGLWNIISTPLEYCMTHDIYHLVPALAVRASINENMSKEQTDSTRTRYLSLWSNFVKHPVFLISFSYCALYMTILSGGALNTAYLKWRGVSNSLLGISRGAGAITGLVGTIIFSYLQTHFKRVQHIAILSVWLFWLCLTPIPLIFILAKESITSDYVMLICVVISRAWLWCTDLAETQIMQEWIAPDQRGAINAMQTALSQFFYILIQFSGIIFHDPHQFEALVFFSLTAVLASALGFTYWGVKYGRFDNNSFTTLNQMRRSARLASHCIKSERTTFTSHTAKSNVISTSVVPTSLSKSHVKMERSECNDWASLCSTQELSCALTLESGQVFSWRRHTQEMNSWKGVIGRRVFALREYQGMVQFRCLYPLKLSYQEGYDELSYYFRLDMSADLLYERWTETKDQMSDIIKRLRGLRIVRQDPVECLFSFICSSNNNIARIQGMVDKLKATYGDLIYNTENSVENDKNKLFYAFPSVETLARKCDEETLRALGFGYRAAFIVKTAKQLQKLGGASYLNSIRDDKTGVSFKSSIQTSMSDEENSTLYQAYQEKLMVFTGVGRKVADCVALFSLEKLEAIPVDTHVWQIACRELDPTLNDRKSITPSVYRLVGDLFRARFAPQAGWAHSVLFAGDLSAFKLKTSDERNQMEKKRKSTKRKLSSKR